MCINTRSVIKLNIFLTEHDLPFARRVPYNKLPIINCQLYLESRISALFVEE